MKRLTVDTNVLQDYILRRPGHADALHLLELDKAGKVSIAVSTRITFDVSKDPLRTMLEGLDFMVCSKVGTGFRIGYSQLDSGDMLVGQEYEGQQKALMDLIWPFSDPEKPDYQNKISDIDHLLGHKLAGRDVFITRDDAILNQHKRLEADFGIQVMSPPQFLASC
jgi:hypothetical protein